MLALHPARRAAREAAPRRGARERMRVVHLLSPGRAGGLETVVQALALGQAARGDEAHVVATSDDEAARAYLARFAGTGVAVATLGTSGRAYRRERSATAALCRRVAPHVVHTHGYRPDVLDADVAQRAGIPTVTTIHGFTGGGLRNRLYAGLQRMRLRAFDAVVAVSEPVGAALRRHVDPRRLHVIPNGHADTVVRLDRRTARRVLGIEDDRVLVGWIGRLSAEKGADLMVRAAALLDDVPAHALQVAIVGEGPQRDRIEALVHGLRLGSRVRLQGFVPDAAAIVSAFDVLVSSSRAEGTPMVLLDAMAARVPIVATRVGGIPFLLPFDRAILVAPENPRALADGIRATLRDPLAARARARRAEADVATRYSPERWVERYAAVYRAVSPLPLRGA